MGLTRRKPRPLNRKISHLRDTKLIIIATEGHKTEKQYFKIFENIRAQVVVIPSEDNRSAPEYILERLNSYSEAYQMGINDELWLMVDTDRWGDKKLSEISQEAKKKNYFLAISNPCFEVWLYLHIDSISTNFTECKALKKILRQKLGSYNPSKLNLNVYKPNIALAIRRAKDISPDDGSRWPASTGTHVYKIVEKII
jgi:hypothetical protein